ncbi:unnamed protein product [Cyclocybe aegerita]|uniref:FAD-binding PCMH-type domain-containing protein n=1 Tax=Cyclocybe aegerita TaxID=1973307 RepID=A0A8S0VUX4_CYCAE|nr:unnamed protein product [Cyclocybe aegerita]
MHSPPAMGALLAALLHGVSAQGLLGQVNSPAWKAFNSTVGGRLALGIPWPKPCFSVYNNASVTPDPDQCAFVQQNYFNVHKPRADAFGGYSALQFEACMSTGDECMLDWTNPTNRAAFTLPQTCDQGSVPPLYVDVKDENDVIATLNFVRRAGVNLVIKNTGHDFKGRSSAPDSLALWMHHLKSMTFVPKFVPEKCTARGYGVTAITIGAGVQFDELYRFADSHGVEIVGGSDETVGAAGGFLQGGGHSSISPSAGMAADRVLQYKVVTPDGVYRTANAYQNSDLFFALRGGGGGTFGIVMEATILATPARSYQIASITWPINDDNLRQIMTLFVDNATTFATQGWGGYLTPSTGSLVMTTPNLSPANAKKSAEALVNLSAALGGTPTVTTLSSFYQWYSQFVGNNLAVIQDAVGLPNALTSRLIPEKNHRTAAGRAELVDAMMNSFSNSIFSQIHLTTPFGFKGADGSGTSVNPVWRKSLYQVILVNTWFFSSTLADRQGAYAQSTKAANILRDITPGSGAYLNEADIHEPNYKVSFYGPYYEKLLQIKNKYDPNLILDCWQCVGWKGPTASQYRCYI